jgi:hypothetical protein
VQRTINYRSTSKVGDTARVTGGPDDETDAPSNVVLDERGIPQWHHASRRFTAPARTARRTIGVIPA